MRLDIVLPAHNEERRIGRTLQRYRRALDEPDVRFLVALDGCTDGTAAIVARQAASDPRVRLLEFPKLGKGGVLAEALRASGAPMVAFVDADGATPPAELLRLRDHLVADPTCDLAIASRRLPASVNPAPRSLARRITSTGFALAIRSLFGLPFADTQCGAKVLTNEAATRLLPLVSSRDFLFDVDLLVGAQKLGMRTDEIPTVWIDKDGSKLDAVRDARRMAASAVRLWLHHRVIPVEQTPAPLTDGLPVDDNVIDLVPHATSAVRHDRLVGA